MFLFTRRQTYHFPLSKEELKSRLTGKHVKIHNLDFEIEDNDGILSIIPHAEQIETIKTLPETSVVFFDEANGTKAVVTSKLRQLDSGGPYLIMTFCSFMLIASFVMLKMIPETTIAFTLIGISVLILTVFGIRMQMGYFDYVHKVRGYIKDKAGNRLPAGTMPLMQA